MTKRILAIVMALVMSMTLLSVNVFADMNVSLNYADKKLTLTWTTESSATRYVATIYNSANNAQVSTQTFSVSNGTVTTKLEIANPAGGSYYGKVVAYNGSREISSKLTSTDAYVPSQSTSGGITVVGQSSSSTQVSFSTRTGITQVYVVYTFLKDSKTSEGNIQLTSNNANYSTSLPIAYSSLQSIRVYVGTAADHDTSPISSWTNTGVSLSPSNPSQSGPVYLYGTTLYWTNTTPNQVYTIKYSINGYSSSSIQVPVYQGSTTNNGATRYVSVATIISQFTATYGSNYGYLTFEVLDSSGTSIGSTYYSPYSSQTTYGGYITAQPYGSGTVVLSFYYPAATSYLVVETSTGTGSTVSGTSTVVYANGYSNVSYSVYAQTTGGQVLIGTVVIGPTGNVISNSASQQTTAQNSSGVTSTGCTMRVGTTSSTVYWTNTYGYSLFYIAYTNNVTNETSYQVAYTTSATIPLGSTNCRNFTVTILGMTGYGTTTGNQSIGYATYVGANDNTPSKSETKGLKLTAKSSSATTVSWDPVDNASYYRIMYQRLDTEAGKEEVLTKTSFDLPMGKNISYQVYVWAVLTTNRTVNVGSATHIKGDDYPSETTTTNPSTTDKTDTTPEYVTNFKGTTGSKKITLSWSAAKGNPTYTIYWKRTSASEWKKAGTTSKRSTTIKGLNNGVSYDFKIVANGRDSGILTIAPSSSGTSTKTAADPSGSGTVSNVPVLKSAKGDKGKITASWNAVKNANKYSLWIAEEGTTKYKSKTVSWVTSDTSITISGVSAGTYKVRIKASTDNGKTWSNLGDCDYMTVTVS